MKTIYLDNAATTPMLPEVVEVMQNSMLNNFGNPSSTHQFGRKAKTAIETVRKNIAKHFNVSASEIFFTSGGTEANNLILQNAVENLGVKKIITSKLEHNAILRTVEFLQEKYNIKVEYLAVDDKGVVSLEDLKKHLSDASVKTLVSLMYVNNEIGNLLPIDKVASICKKYNVYFHSDTVQAIGRYKIDLKEISVDFIVASAHKFHGPKGVGFVFVKKGIAMKPMIHGGKQERGIRSGTENVHAILGMEKAMRIAYDNLKKDVEYIKELKKYFIIQLKENFKSIEFNGNSADVNKSTYTILNVRFPVNDKMMLFNLDLQGVAASGGSACQSGANKKSHVLAAFLNEEDVKKTSIRFSFSKFIGKQDVDACVLALKNINT